MTDDDKPLVAHLRRRGPNGGLFCECGDKAADRIEEQALVMERVIEFGLNQAFEVGVLREALDWMAESEPLVVEAILSRARAALAGRKEG